jgi:sec-independent protein translocase protein TatA
MFANLNGWHAVIIIAVILLLFGAPKIPQLARSLGQSMKILKTEIRDDPKPAADDTPPVEERAAQ